MNKTDFIRIYAPKIALAIAPSRKVDFPAVIELAASWYDEIEEYIAGMNSDKGYGEPKPEEEPSISTTAFPEYSHILDPEVREAIVAIFD